MEKKKYSLDIAGVNMAIISDEREEFVLRLAEELDGDIVNLTLRNKNCSKLDAAILCALDYASEKVKAEKRVRNLEAQVALYDANLRRMKEENAKLRGDSFVAIPRASEGEVAADDIDDLSALDGIEETEGEPAVHTEEAEQDTDNADNRLRKIEELLGQRDNGENAEDEKRDNKLRQIESLLRSKEN